MSRSFLQTWKKLNLFGNEGNSSFDWQSEGAGEYGNNQNNHSDLKWIRASMF